MLSVAGPSKETICGSCPSRTCCYHYKVTITGYDMWRIARTLDIPPSQFVVYTDADAENEETFVLAPDGRRYELVLAKTADPRRYGGCLFLVATNGGVHRCGLGDLRPEPCQVYPAYFHDGLARVINDPRGCWRSWSLGELDLDEEERRTQDHERHRAEYREILDDWNRRVWRGDGREHTFQELCDYLENRYAAREAPD